VRVEGKPQLNGARMDVIPDRIEALTWIVYAILSRGEVLIESVPFESMQIPCFTSPMPASNCCTTTARFMSIRAACKRTIRSRSRCLAAHIRA